LAGKTALVERFVEDKVYREKWREGKREKSYFGLMT